MSLYKYQDSSVPGAGYTPGRVIRSKFQCAGRLPAHAQQGFVLVLSLVMLAVLTLIGVSSMNSANMELKSTGNARQHQVAFNAAQAVVEYATSDPGVVAINYLTKTPNSIASYTHAGASNVSAAVSYAGCSVAIGSSLEEGKGFSYNFFTVAGTASNSTNTATSLQSQGVRYPAAGC